MKQLNRALLIVGAILAVLPGAAQAATISANTSNIAISPAIEQINLKPHQDSTTFTTKVTNNNGTSVVVEIQMNDFTALNQTGSVSFIGTQYASNNLHGLAQWMKADSPYLTLGPGSTQSVTITISDVAQLAPGGHYGAVIYRVVPADLAGKGNQFITNEEVSTLVFLTTSSGRVQAITLHRPSLSSVVTAMPSSVNLVFANTGNTQVTPYGLVTVTDGKNREITRSIINVDSGLVLPATKRLYQIGLKYERHMPWLADSYHLNISYRAGSNGPLQTYSKHFFYVNPVGILILVASLVGAVAIVTRLRRYLAR